MMTWKDVPPENRNNYDSLEIGLTFIFQMELHSALIRLDNNNITKLIGRVLPHFRKRSKEDRRVF